MRSCRSLVTLAATVCLLLSGCDTFTSPRSNPLSRQQAVPSSEDTTTSTLSFRHWPEGTPLPSVSEWEDASDSASPSPKESASSLPEGASPYGCLISTLDPEATPHPYRYDDLYVHYPDSVATAAGDSTRTLTIVYGSNDLFAEQSRSEKIVVRVARCRIPGIDGARRPLMERLQQFNEKNKPAQPEAEETAPSVSAFIAAIEDSASTKKVGEKSLQKEEEENCTTATICVSGHCWIDSTTCDSGGDSSGGDYGDSYGDNDGNGSTGGGSGFPSDSGGQGDGGESADPCDGTHTSICDDPDRGPDPDPSDDSDSDSESSSNDQPQREKLDQYLKSHKFALLDVPCDEIPEYTDLARRKPPQSVVNRLKDLQLRTPDGLTQNAFIQSLQDASGPRVNLDYYGVRVPKDELPGGRTPKEYFEHWRTNFNSFFDDNQAQFRFYPFLSNEDQRWQNNPLGTVFSIQLMAFGQPWIEDGSVVTTNVTESSWTFSTVWTPADLAHPVSGNREFGFTRNGDGTVTFYTRGVDRITNSGYYFLSEFSKIANKGIFKQGEGVWENMVKHLKEDLGPNATNVSEEPIRPAYNKFEKVRAGANPAILECQ